MEAKNECGEMYVLCLLGHTKEGEGHTFYQAYEGRRRTHLYAYFIIKAEYIGSDVSRH